MKYKNLGKTNEKIASLGIGTWNMDSFDDNIQVIRKAVELGINFIDTAEMYGSGLSEKIVGEAISDIRDQVFIATKVVPSNISYDNLIKAAERSLERLKIKTIDLYQIHWPSSSIPISESMKAMEYLVDQGKIRYIGVSNFSVKETSEAQTTLSKYDLVSNQVEYNLLKREIELDLLPYCNKENITVIAYTPLANLDILSGERGKIFTTLAQKYNKTPIQTALNWILTKPNVTTIPKTSSLDHLEEIYGTLDWEISSDDIVNIETMFSI